MGITPVPLSPCAKPRRCATVEIHIRGYALSLRRSEAQTITVEVPEKK
jgi:Fe2+ transport system protein FeoA